MVYLRKTKSIAAVIFILALISGCAAGPALVNTGGIETRVDKEFEPLKETDTEQLLDFCVLESLEKKYYFQDYEYYLKEGLEPISVGGEEKPIAPFKSISRVSKDKSDWLSCDAIFEITQADGLGYPPFKLVAFSARTNERLMSAQAGGRGGYSQLHGLPRVLRIAYNAFVPGSALYQKVLAEKKRDESSFESEAVKYRELPVKPSLPEEARKFKVQAEAAFNKRDFKEAAARYQDALKTAPWWPEGHFNAALILGEIGRHKAAIKEMRKYLLLVPGAPDAREAQDKIYEWEGLIGK